MKPPRGPDGFRAQSRARTLRNDRLKDSPKRKQPTLTSWIGHSWAEVNEGNGPLRSGRSRRNYDRQKCMARALLPEMRNSSILDKEVYRVHGLPWLLISIVCFFFVLPWLQRRWPCSSKVPIEPHPPTRLPEPRS